VQGKLLYVAAKAACTTVEIRKIRENPWLLIICLSERPNEVIGKPGKLLAMLKTIWYYIANEP